MSNAAPGEKRASTSSSDSDLLPILDFEVDPIPEDEPPKDDIEHKLKEKDKRCPEISATKNNLMSPRRLKAVINCVPQALPEDIVKLYGSVDKSRKRKLSINVNSNESIDQSIIDDNVIININKGEQSQKSDNISSVNDISDQNSPNKRSNKRSSLSLSKSLMPTRANQISKPYRISTDEIARPVNTESFKNCEATRVGHMEQSHGMILEEDDTIITATENDSVKCSGQDSTSSISNLLHESSKEQISQPSIRKLTDTPLKEQPANPPKSDMIVNEGTSYKISETFDDLNSGRKCVPTEQLEAGEVSHSLLPENLDVCDGSSEDQQVTTVFQPDSELPLSVKTADINKTAKENSNQLVADLSEILKEESIQIVNMSVFQKSVAGSQLSSTEEDKSTGESSANNGESSIEEVASTGESCTNKGQKKKSDSPILSQQLGNTEADLTDLKMNIAMTAGSESVSVRKASISPPLPMDLDVVKSDSDETDNEEPTIAESDSGSINLSDKKHSRPASIPDKMNTRNSEMEDKPEKKSSENSKIPALSDKKLSKEHLKRHAVDTADEYRSVRRSSKRSVCTLVNPKKARNHYKTSEKKIAKQPLFSVSTSSSRDSCKSLTRSSSGDTAPLFHSKLEVKDTYDKSLELATSDKFYEVKRTIREATRGTSGVDIKRYKQFSNIFLKNWRYSKQFYRTVHARTKQIARNTLEKIVKTLYEKNLFEVKGPADSIDTVKMILEEIKADNSRILSQTPPTITVLVTESMFEKYYSTGSREPAIKRAPVRTVSLGQSTDQWLRIKKELGMESHSEVAAILMHCYKAWSSVACSRCRRHMEIGMEQKTGRSLLNSETSVCIVSCECGKSTSGGFMIECDSCHKWQHGVCVGVQKDDVPAQYACNRCCNIRGSVVSAAMEEGAESDASVVSIDNTELYSSDDSQPEVIELD